MTSDSNCSELEGARKAADRAQSILDDLRIVRDVEAYRELFFDLHLANQPRVLLPIAKAISMAAPKSEFAHRVRRLRGIINAPAENRETKTRQLEAEKKRLSDMGWTLDPAAVRRPDGTRTDKIRLEVEEYMRTRSQFGDLSVAYQWVKATDRFHETHFGAQLGRHIDDAETRATERAVRFGELLAEALTASPGVEALDVRTSFDLHAPGTEERAEYLGRLAGSVSGRLVVTDCDAARRRRELGSSDSGRATGRDVPGRDQTPPSYRAFDGWEFGLRFTPSA